MSDRTIGVLTFQCEPPLPLLEEARALFAQHYDEIAVHKALFGAPNPDVEQYRSLAKMGILYAVTARDDGRLAGYFVFIVKRNAHYRHVTGAIEDLYFLAKEYRTGLNGYRFLSHAVKAMEATGADYCAMRTKLDHSHGLLLDRLGFRAIETVYQKVTDHG